MSLSIEQTSHRKGRHHWSWSLRLTGPAEEMAAVQSVVYTLHPTFSPPVHRVDDPESGFRLKGSGWGEFMVHVKVLHRDGTETPMEHWLELEDAGSDGLEGNLEGEGVFTFSKDSLGGGSSGPEIASAPSPAPAAARAVPQPAQARPSAPEHRAEPEPASAGEPGEAAEAAVEGAVEAPPPGPRRTVYLSAGLADRPAASRVRDALASADIDVRAGDQLSPRGDSIEAMIREQLEKSDAAIFLLSSRSSPWARQEAALASAMGMPLAVVQADPSSPIPGELGTLAAMTAQLPPTADDPQVMRPLTAWASALTIRNKRPGGIPGT